MISRFIPCSLPRLYKYAHAWHFDVLRNITAFVRRCSLIYIYTFLSMVDLSGDVHF